MRISSFSATLILLLSNPLLADELTVTVNGIEHTKGQIYLVLYNSSETFLDEEKSLSTQTHAASVGEITAHFKDLEPGDYAILAYHDENGDSQLNRFLGMIPSEGYGLSRNPEVFGKPKFDDARITLEGSQGTTITLTY